MPTTDEKPVVEIVVEPNNKETVTMQGYDCLVDVEDRDCLVDLATIIVPDTTKDLTDCLQSGGQKIRIRMGWGRKPYTIFEGLILPHKNKERSQHSRRVKIAALDPSCLLHLHKRKPRIWTGTLEDIIYRVVSQNQAVSKKLISVEKGSDKKDSLEKGATILIDDVDRGFKFTKEKPLIQFNETDLHFIYRIANLYGYRAFVEYNRQAKTGKAASQFYFVSTKRIMQGARLTTLHYCHWGTQLKKFEYNWNAADAEPRLTAVVVDPTDGVPVKIKTTAEAQTKALPPNTLSPQRIAELKKQGVPLDNYKDVVAALQKNTLKLEDLVHYDAEAGRPSDPNRSQLMTRQDPTRLLGLQGKGVAVGNVQIRAKGKIGIIGFSSWEEGDWYVHKVNHVFRQDSRRGEPSFVTKFEVSR